MQSIRRQPATSAPIAPATALPPATRDPSPSVFMPMADRAEEEAWDEIVRQRGGVA